MIFDTDVIIWYMRGSEKAADVIESTASRHVSAVTYMELIQGARNGTEKKLVKSIISDLDFEVLGIDENISHRAIVYIEEYGMSSGLRLADALIAATAAENNMKLITGNLRHFHSIRDIEAVGFREK